MSPNPVVNPLFWVSPCLRGSRPGELNALGAAAFIGVVSTSGGATIVWRNIIPLGPAAFIGSRVSYKNPLTV
jgi:hypothetical protein